MKYSEVINMAKGQMGDFCKVCPICDGRACKNTMPGPGSKGLGKGATRNYEKWQEICLNMDTISENKPVDLKVKLFGQEFDYPIFAAPVGALKMHYGEKYDDLQYNEILVPSCANNGIAAFTGDGFIPEVFVQACEVIGKLGGVGIPTVKPWGKEVLFKKLDMAKKAGAKMIAMDIDGAGLPFMKNQTPVAGSKTVDELREIFDYAQTPFIMKGIMTVKGAEKALEAGAAGIVVSNHGGRVLEGCPSTAEVLPEIAEAVGGKMTILVDGGIRTGIDIFRALALGADAVLIARPFVTAVYGNGEEGVKTYIQELADTLADAMEMCGVHSIAEIDKNCVRF